MAVINEAHNLSISIDRPVDEVYDFASRPENFPRWATGLATALEPEGDHWVAATSEGSVQVRFTPPNEHGILDHHVTMTSGVAVYVPMRVVANGSGSELIFTLFRAPGMSEEVLSRDIEWVTRDLETLKALLE